jgi:lipopolysaccharide export LptBFGC system permease protein LptF
VSNLVIELLLRLLKPLLAVVLGLLLYAVVTGPLGEPGSAVLALVCVTLAGVVVVLMQESPL